MNIKWEMVGIILQAVLLGGGMLTGFTVALTEQRAFAAETTEKLKQVDDRVDKLYDLLIYPHVAKNP